MSYILEALKRAEAERERGSLPTLMSQTVAVETPAAKSPAPTSPQGLKLALGLAALLGVLGLGIWLGGGPAAPEATAQSPEPTLAAAPPAAPAAPRPPAPAPGVQASTEAPVPPLASRVIPPAPLPSPSPASTPNPAGANPRPSGPTTTLVREAAKPALAEVPTPSIATPTATPAPIPALKDLPEALRRELPPLSASGAMYSDTPSKRMLIINGQLLQEGARVAPDLVLEQIELKSAVLSYKGQRFRISY